MSRVLIGLAAALFAALVLAAALAGFGLLPPLTVLTVGPLLVIAMTAAMSQVLGVNAEAWMLMLPFGVVGTIGAAVWVWQVPDNSAVPLLVYSAAAAATATVWVQIPFLQDQEGTRSQGAAVRIATLAASLYISIPLLMVGRVFDGQGEEGFNALARFALMTGFAPYSGLVIGLTAPVSNSVRRALGFLLAPFVPVLLSLLENRELQLFEAGLELTVVQMGCLLFGPFVFAVMTVKPDATEISDYTIPLAAAAVVSLVPLLLGWGVGSRILVAALDAGLFQPGWWKIPLFVLTSLFVVTDAFRGAAKMSGLGGTARLPS